SGSPPPQAPVEEEDPRAAQVERVHHRRVTTALPPADGGSSRARRCRAGARRPGPAPPVGFGAPRSAPPAPRRAPPPPMEEARELDDAEQERAGPARLHLSGFARRADRRQRRAALQ